ncbi:hypothetical protein PspLS_10125 [Pyricularia sp. CBS 133598]|nr:hypothetical protein PspLS_10125 [Pyricularia sp. CBS 133598]
MAKFSALCSLALLGLAGAQKPVGTETHEKLTTFRCTVAGGCVEKTNYVVLDSITGHRIFQPAAETLDCGARGAAPNVTACPTKEACAENCAIEGRPDYSVEGVTTDGTSIRLQILHDGKKVAPRVYLLDEAEEKYEMLKLTGNEFSFDVAMDKLPCGMNSALYLSEMEENGGKSALNPGGAPWGTGYCDAQCYVTPFINGEGNIKGNGACCAEMDIWEANSRATHIAPHPCSKPGLYLCEGDECGSTGVCDKAGCAWNPNRIGQPHYYGNNDTFKVDTLKPMTVVTQFPTDAAGKLSAIRRLYVQDGIVIKAETVHKAGLPEVDALDDPFCDAFGAKRYMALGATGGMGDALTRGMVLVMSIWWDESGGNMQWLDGQARGSGPCNATEGAPANIPRVQPNPEVTFSNVKWGEIGSTFQGGARRQ